jgi:DNA-binding MarR family transcriptional regulator
MARPERSRLEVWQQFLHAHQRVLAVLGDELEQERGLPLAWYEVLLHVERAPDRRLRMGDLADAVVLSPSGLTRLVDRMVDDGLVRREPCPSDRRSTYAVLTADGRSALRRAAPTHLRGIDEHFASLLTDDEVAALSRALGRVLDALDEPASEPRRRAPSA